VPSIAELIEKAYANEKPDGYVSKSIGASAVGNSCDAYLSLSLRGAPDLPPPPQLKRIFRDGHRIETSVLADMKKAGINVMEKNNTTGKQFRWDKFGGHIVFKADGVIDDPSGAKLLEIKSMNDALWNKFKSYGIFISHRHYYDQMQLGMGMSGIKSCVLVAYNKDNSRYWDEEVKFDIMRYSYLMARAEAAMGSHAERVAHDETDWRCRSCSKAKYCWGDAPKEESVRLCANSSPLPDGKFACTNGCTDKCLKFTPFRPRPRT
jgi:hypothetical protein